MGLDVDDAGRDDEAVRVDPAPGRHAREHAGGRDARDAVTDDPDVAVEPGIAGAVDDLPVGDHDVVRWCGPGIRGADGRRVGTGGEGDERGAKGEEESHASEHGMRA